MNQNQILAVSGLTVTVKQGNQKLEIIKDISFSLEKGKILGIVGESGCGKSMTALAITGLLPEAAKISSGAIFFEGQDLVKLATSERRKLLGSTISMIFQEPMTSLNPLVKVGKQIAEVLYIHNKMKEKTAYPFVIEGMKLAGISEADKLYHYYPHQLSGGLRQRIMIAMALVCKPKLLIADEPTTALDVTVQKEILLQLKKACQELNTAMLIISHDLGVISHLCENMAVMYAGRLLEYGKTSMLLTIPKNEYTKALLASIPTPEQKGKPLKTIPGIVPSAGYIADGCPFAVRCSKATELCVKKLPLYKEISPNHYVACHYADGEDEDYAI